jgi:hypothetical protein
LYWNVTGAFTFLQSHCSLPFLLDLLRAPSSIGISHIRRRLELWREFQCAVAEAGKADDCSGDVSEDGLLKQD